MQQTEKKSKSWIIIIIILLVLLIIGGGIAYFIFGFNLGIGRSKRTITLTNPVTNLTDEQAIAQFDESFVLYLLASIGAQNLHNPPLSSNTPKIGIHVGGDIYSSEIKKGVIRVSRESYDLEKVDIVIRTSKGEAIQMLRNRDNIVKSFNEGLSTIELIAGKTELLVKGYLSLYTELTGEEPPEE